MNSEEEVVISGIAGRFPQADSVEEYEQKLSDGVYMVDDSENRIKWKFPNQPTKFGLMRNLEKFDSQAFRVPSFLSKSVDPQGRILLEHVFESIIDAGVSPTSIMGTKTGVYIGCFNYDSLDYWMYDKTTRMGMSSVGNAAYALANRISFALGAQGPSMAVDTACSSSMYALNLAFNDIKNGNCNAAIVAGTNLILSPMPIEDFSRSGVLTKTGISQPFDKNASGYVRAEACCAIFLQRASDARRVYATILNCKTNNDGFKREGPLVPSSEVQMKLYQSVYEDSKVKIDPSTVDYIEAHATSTQVGDKQEIKSIDEYFCRNRINPLKIGSVKSNIGHAEGAAGLTSVIKALLMFENEKFYKNLNITELRDDCTALVEKRIEVVQKNEEFNGKLIGVSSFGVNGSNGHVLLQKNTKKKINQGIPTDNLPRLLTWSGRTEESVNKIFDEISKKKMDDEFLTLLQSSQIQSNSSCLSKGFAIFDIKNENQSTTEILEKKIVEFDGVERSIVFMYSGVGSQWINMGRDLLKIPLIAEKIEECHQILLKKQINLKNILTLNDKEMFSNCLNIFVSVAAIQIALTDLLRLIGITPNYFIGHSAGEVTCAYADGGLTLKEAILTAFERGYSIQNVKRREQGLMAAIGIGFNELKNIIPEKIEIACHNSLDSCTISGKVEAVKTFVDEMKNKNVFAKIVDSANVAFHSSLISESGPILLNNLKSIITAPKKRSDKWISTSIPKDKWNDEIAQFSSAEYFANNLLSPVLFEEAAQNLPEKSLVIEIAPHGLLHSIIKKCLPNSEYVSLTKRDIDDGLIFLLKSLGKLYQSGVDIDVRQIYPKIDFPVAHSTQMISPLVKWNHNENIFVPMFDPITKCDKRSLFISLSDPKYSFMRGHTLGGRIILPATGYLYFVWETYAMMHCETIDNFTVCFEEVKFIRATILTKDHDTELTINIQRGSGYFEIIDGMTTIVSGIIKKGDDEKLKDIEIYANGKVDYKLNSSDFYKELTLRGYEYAEGFIAIDTVEKVSEYQIRADIEWKSNWVIFLDCILQSMIIGYDSRDLFLPTLIGKLIINPQIHQEIIDNQQNDEKEKILIELKSDYHLKSIRCGGVELIGFIATFVSKPPQITSPTLECYKFIPHFPTPKLTNLNAAKFCVQILLENNSMLSINIAEIDDGFESESLLESFVECLDKIPLIMSDFTYFTKKENFEMKDVKISNEELSSLNNKLNILIVKNAFNDIDQMEKMFDKIDENGFLLWRQDQVAHKIPLQNKFQCISIVTLENEFIHIINRKPEKSDETLFEIPENINNFQWIEELKNEIVKKNCIILSRSTINRDFSGILGFFNCLKKEPNVKKLRCLFIDNKEKNIYDNEFLTRQLNLGMLMNVFKDGKWGSYRHLSFPSIVKEKNDRNHSFVNLLTRGDISSLKWVDGNLKSTSEKIIEIHYCALNYRDVLTATTRIILDYEFDNRIERQHLCGYEYSGITKSGRRVMGMVKSKAISNFISEDETLAIDIPSNWSLEEAATVPLVYITVYMAFFECATIEKGKSVLIHAGSGGVGLAAIRVALGYGLNVFTTCSTEDKKNYLLQEFPQLEKDNIGNSRDISFETMVITRTNGRGVDFVLNSLSEDKMQASIRCLADGGTFLEVGKFDMLMGNKISLSHFLRGITFKAVLLNLKSLMGREDRAKVILEQMERDMHNGIIRPLKTNVFAAHEVEEAFRFLATSKHIGKVLINVKDHDEEKSISIPVLPRIYFDIEKSYILLGGTGGMGMEIADWMILRNCKKIILSSSRGITNSYQEYRLNIWKSYGVKIHVTTSNITTREGCKEILEEAIKLGPAGGIFNLAGIIDDKLFEKMDEECFKKVYEPKVNSTLYLDELSRKLCPQLDHFVVFSSIACGYGNIGQTNYGFANSAMERIVEKRRLEGFPAKAIQWGPIDEVGMMKKMSDGKEIKSFFGMIPQKIQSCYDTMNNILSCNETIVSSIVVAEKHKNVTNSKEFFEKIMIAMGIPDIKSIDKDKPISSLGLDSIGGTEIQQALEREFSITLSIQELKTKTLNELEALIGLKSNNIKVQSITSLMDSMWTNIHSGMLNDKLIEEIKVVNGKPKMLLIPGMIAGLGSMWKNLDYSIYILQHMKYFYLKSFEELFSAIIDDVQELYKDDQEFILVGYSFGSLLALKICERFESMGKHGKLIFIDGSPYSMRTKVMESVPNKQPTDENIQNLIFNELAVKTYGTLSDEILRNVGTQTEWILKVEEFTKAITDHQSKEFLEKNLESLHNRLRMVINENFNFNISEKTKTLLIKPAQVSLKLKEDYGLSEYIKGDIKIETVPGDHYSVIERSEILEIIMKS